MLSKLKDKEELLEMLAQDPFKVHALAEYDLIEFIPSMASDEFGILKE